MSLRSLVFLWILIFAFSACQDKANKIVSTATSSFTSNTLASDTKSENQRSYNIPFLEKDDSRVLAIIQQMSLKEKLSHLLIWKINELQECKEDKLYDLAHEGLFGGMILKNQSLDDYIRISQNCQQLASTPLLFGTEEKVSLCNQFADAVPFPNPASIASIANDSIQNDLSQLYIQQCQTLGIHFSLAANHLSQSNSKKNYNNQFEQNYKVRYLRNARLLNNLHQNNILSIGDEFAQFVSPSSETTAAKNEYQSALGLNMYGIAGWKLGDAIYQNDKVQTKGFAQTHLSEVLGFQGLIIDEVNSKKSIERLLNAGVDIFVIKEDIESAFQQLENLYQSGQLSAIDLDAKVKKILKAKTWAFEKSPVHLQIDEAKAQDIILNEHYPFYVQQLYQQSVILANNYQALPFNYTYNRDFQVFHTASTNLKTFEHYMKKYGLTTLYKIDWSKEKAPQNQTVAARLFSKKAEANQGMQKLRAQDNGTKIVVLNEDLDAQKDKALYYTINELANESKIILVNFGNPHNLTLFSDKVSSVQVFEKNKPTEQYVAELLFGGRTAIGKLPLALASYLPFQQSFKTPVTRLNYAQPKELGIDPVKMVGIDAYVNSAIRKKAIPGAQVLVVKDGSIVYNKSFGYHTYNKLEEVKNHHLYDLASLTKITGTTLAAMKLYEQNNFNLEDQLSQYFDLSRNYRMARVTLQKLFTHYSRIQANMPVYPFIKRKSLDKYEICNENFCSQPRLNYSKQIADNLYLRDGIKQEMNEKVLKLKPYKSRRYRYSDVNFNILQQVIEEKTVQGLDKYLYANFYRSLNLSRLMYNPIQRYSKKEIVPTAYDSYWRKQIMHGYVHDESAALLGGVAGNAGLFSNAEDLAVLYQMLLNGGQYGNRSYLDKETIDLFTSRQKGSRRGLGFDKPRSTTQASYSKKVSKNTYGHTGFTGTAVWVDPDSELIYIFLSNRIHPSTKNTKLFSYQTRRYIHDVIYRSFDSYQMELPLQ